MMNRFRHITYVFAIAGFLLLMISGEQKAYADKAKDAPAVELRTGSIDDLGTKKIVIGDISYQFVSSTQYLSSTGKPINRWDFKKGEVVKYHVNNKDHILILKKN